MLRSEERVYKAVENGELRIDPDGTIWRVAARRGKRWTEGTRTIPCTPRRAEHRLPSGYLQVRVMFDGKREHALAHRLVWRHFAGSIPPGVTINHKDGVKDRNPMGNLELATYSDQAHHARDVLERHPSLHQAGEANHQAKLTDAEVARIRERRAAGEPLNVLAAEFGVAFQTISKIARGTRR